MCFVGLEFNFILSHVNAQFSQHNFLENIFPTIFLVLLSKMTCPYMVVFASRVSIQLQVCLLFRELP